MRLHKNIILKTLFKAATALRLEIDAHNPDTPFKLMPINHSTIFKAVIAFNLRIDAHNTHTPFPKSESAGFRTPFRAPGAYQNVAFRRLVH